MRERLADAAMTFFGYLFPIAQIAAIVFLLLIPLAAWRRTRGFAVITMFVISYFCGFTAWVYGAACTLMAWGWIGLGIGLLVLGVGVVPLAMVAALFKSEVPMAVFWISLALVAGAYVMRFTAAAFASKTSRPA
jgi:hypothetical protein